MFKLILKKVAPVPKLESFERYLFVGPHPDDIEVACAPTVAKLTAAGKRVVFAIVADDSAVSAERPTPRQKEAAASGALLGVSDVRFLGYADGGMYSTEELAVKFAELIADIKPDIVLTADPTVPNECHPDHIKTGNAVKHAAMLAPFDFLMRSHGFLQTHQVKALAFFYTSRPNCYVHVGRLQRLRAEAMACHASQFSEKDIADICMYFKLRSLRFGLRRLRGASDGFWCIPLLHMHCFPEAGE